jgi:hypothetical protein
MDDSGGSWTFLGAKNQVLVTWEVYDSETAEYEKGNQVFADCSHFHQVIRTLGTKYHYTFDITARDERRDFSAGGSMNILGPPEKSGAPATRNDAESPKNTRRSVSLTPLSPLQQDT